MVCILQSGLVCTLGGPCYSQDLQSVASYAFNDYFAKHGFDLTACDFSGSAAAIYLHPSEQLITLLDCIRYFRLIPLIFGLIAGHDKCIFAARSVIFLTMYVDMSVKLW